MKVSTFVLVSAAVGLGVIGMGYVLAPQWVSGLSGIGIESVSEASMVRAAYGGLFVASAVFCALGVRNTALTSAALLYVLVFMLGLAGGRTISLLVDGMPRGLILLVHGAEVVYMLLAAWALYRRRHAR